MIYLPESRLSTGALGFMLGDSLPVDVVKAKQGFCAGFPRGTTTAVSGSDERSNGLRYTATGILRLVDATAGNPAGTVIIGGFAVSSSGQLCYTTNAIGSSSVFIGGVATNNVGAVHLSDLSPAAWYRFNQGVTITGQGASTWADKSGNARDLLQATDSFRPAQQTDGSLLFDGIDNYLKTAGFTLNQPTTVVALMKAVTWNGSAYLFDGNTVNSMAGLQRQSGGGGSSPAVTQFGGAYGGQDLTHMTIGAYHVLTMVFSGASSLVRVDLNTAGTGDAGAANAGAFTLGVSGDALQQAGNIQVKEVALFASALSTAQIEAVTRYLARVGGISV